MWMIVCSGFQIPGLKMQVLKKLLQQNGVCLCGFDRGVLLQETRCYSQSPKPEVHGYMMMAYDWWGTMCKELVIGFLWLLLQKSFWVAVGTIGISDEFPGIQVGSWYTWCLRIRCICAHIVGEAHRVSWHEKSTVRKNACSWITHTLGQEPAQQWFIM